MNYYNPYFYNIPSATVTPKVGIFSKLFGGSNITLGGILNGTQRALNFANQAIPLVKQVRPMIGNAKTMFKVMNEFKRSERGTKNNTTINSEKNTDFNTTSNPNKIVNNTEEINKIEITDNNGPTFFM